MRFSRSWRSRIGCALVGVAALLSVHAYAYAAGTGEAPFSIPAHYELTTTNGRAVTENSFKGQWQLVFFGFTSCPDICATTMLSVRYALAALGPASAHVQPIFVTLDPERDTAQTLADYLQHFGPNVIGLRGTDAQVHAAARAFRVFVKTRALGADGYTVDHSAFLYLLGPDGRFRHLFSGDAPGHQLADELRAAMQ
jgi:protein SCO1/2